MNKELTKTRQLTRIEKFGATYKLFRLSGVILQNLTLLNSKVFRILHAKFLAYPEIQSCFSNSQATQLAPVKQHLSYHDSIMAFKCMYCLVLENLIDQFIELLSMQTSRTRISQLLNIPLFRTANDRIIRVFYYRIVSLWNVLP
ncbi:hypothetical protein P5673_009911 [Acropora cervicornis]|uniref:Uncharacterized protein n=1 Tax=Acropora cervicornis TaxID=6130 RepID=A0AAD9V9N4_ACRCE|nr:hypothetical protein P5673_009911 [Acropora cervicornis]